MRIKNIHFQTHLEDITDIENANLEVVVELENGYTYVVVVATTKNIESLMDDNKMNYFQPSNPFIIVKELTKDIIEETIQAYVEDEDDGYWLKFHHFAGKIKPTVFDELEAEYIKEKEFDDYDDYNDDWLEGLEVLDELDNS